MSNTIKQTSKQILYIRTSTGTENLRLEFIAHFTSIRGVFATQSRVLLIAYFFVPVSHIYVIIK